MRSRGVVFDTTRCAFLAPASPQDKNNSSSTTKGGGSGSHAHAQPGAPPAEAIGAGVEVLTVAELSCLLEVLGPAAAQHLAAHMQPVIAECVRALHDALGAREPQLLSLDEACSAQGQAGFGAAARAVLADHAQAGPFSLCELSAVVGTARVLGKCLAFRVLLGAAVQQVTHAWAPYWSQAMASLSIPHTLHGSAPVGMASVKVGFPVDEHSVGSDPCEGDGEEGAATIGSRAAQTIAAARAARAACAARAGSERSVADMLQVGAGSGSDCFISVWVCMVGMQVHNLQITRSQHSTMMTCSHAFRFSFLGQGNRDNDPTPWLGYC